MVEEFSKQIHSKIKSYLFSLFFQPILDALHAHVFGSNNSSDAPRQPQKQSETQNNGSTDQGTSSTKPKMSAHEVNEPGKFWDRPGNDIHAWADDIVRAERDGNGEALNSIAERLSTPDLTILLQQVDATREKYQAAQEKFTKDIIAADKIRAENASKNVVDPQIEFGRQEVRKVHFFRDDLIVTRLRGYSNLTAEERIAFREARYEAEREGWINKAFKDMPTPKPGSRSAEPLTAEERLADREAGYQAERKAGPKNEIPEMTLGELREPWPLKFGPYRGFDLG